MSRGFADRTRLAAFAARRAWRTGIGRLNAHPAVRWRFTPAMSDRLLIAPQDLRTADPTRASEIYAGRFAFAGKIVICDGRSPFEIEPPSEEWSDQLLGFGWLRHLRAAESAITRANARALVDEWIALPGAAGVARTRHALLPPLPAQPDAPGALPAPRLQGDARRSAANAGDHGADLCGAVHAGTGAHDQGRHAAADR